MSQHLASKHQNRSPAWALGLLAAALFAASLSLASPEVQAEGAPARRGKFQRSRLTADESEALADRRTVRLTKGENKTVDVDFVIPGIEDKYLLIGNKQLVQLDLIKGDGTSQLIFKPQGPGETTVTVRDEAGVVRIIFTVRVSGSNLLRQASEIRELLRDIEGIDVRIVGPKIVVDGEVLVPADYGRLLSVITDKAYIDSVLNLTTLSPLAMQVLAKRIQEDVNSFAPNVKTRVVNGMIFLEGTVDSADQATRAAEVAKIYLPEIRPSNPLLNKDQNAQAIQGRPLIQNFIVINAPPPKKQEKLVRVTFHFVELAKDYIKNFGFKWAPGFTSSPEISIGTGTAGGADASGATFSGTLSQLLPKLQSAQSAGYAKILKSGTVVVRSGQPATLDDQTEIPYSTMSNGQPMIAKDNVGMVAAVTPSILGQSEDISMDLELSQRTLSGRTPNGVLISNHKVKTKVYVRNNESAAIAGVNAGEVTTSFNRDDPRQVESSDTNTDTLFSLMRSKNYNKKKSQFVIFVTPQIIENASEGTEDLKKNFRVKVK